jgi:hypothetical protein
MYGYGSIPYTYSVYMRGGIKMEYIFSTEDKQAIIDAGLDPDDFSHMYIAGNRISFYYNEEPVFGVQLAFVPCLGRYMARKLPGWLRGIR